MADFDDGDAVLDSPISSSQRNDESRRVVGLHALVLFGILNFSISAECLSLKKFTWTAQVCHYSSVDSSHGGTTVSTIPEL